MYMILIKRLEFSNKKTDLKWAWLILCGMMKDLKPNYSVTKSRLKLLMVNFFSKKQQDRNLLIYLMEKLEIIFSRKMIAWQKIFGKKISNYNFGSTPRPSRHCRVG